MFIKICDDILFRKYDEYGYITDNSEFGYRLLSDNRPVRGEKFVSQSGAVMLSVLDRVPKHIDDIVNELFEIFIGVDKETLKVDAIEFFQYFFDKGYLSIGETYQECKDRIFLKGNDSQDIQQSISMIGSEDCIKNIFKANELLRSIHIEVANICNERCVHCYIPHEYKNNIINSELFYKIIEIGRKMNIIHVTLSGGEPLLHPDIIEFLRKCRKMDLSVNVLSNLTVLNDEIITEMKQNPLLSVQTSIYSMNAEIHDSITKLNGSFEKTIKGLEILSSRGIPVQISCPIMKQNRESFIDVIRWGKKHNIAVAIEPVIFASYDHTGKNLSHRLSLEEMERTIDLELSEGYAEQLYEIAKEKESFTENDPICSICRYSFCISVLGDVYSCVGWQTNVLGNLKNQSLQDIWENSEKIKYLRQIKRKEFPKCVNCEDRGYCTVCMMSNSNENQNGDAFKIEDFHCSVAKIIHKKVKTYCEGD